MIVNKLSPNFRACVSAGEFCSFRASYKRVMASQEEILLWESLNDLKDDRISASAVVQLIQNIITGLGQTNSSTDKQFWEIKIAYNLLNGVLYANEDILTPSFSQTTSIPWGLFFNIIKKCRLLRATIELTLQENSLNLLLLVTSQWWAHVVNEQEEMSHFLFHLTLLSVIASPQHSENLISEEHPESLEEVLKLSGECLKECARKNKLDQVPLKLIQDLHFEAQKLQAHFKSLGSVSCNAALLYDINQLLNQSSYSNQSCTEKIALFQELVSAKQTRERFKITSDVLSLLKKELEHLNSPFELIEDKYKNLYDAVTSFVAEVKAILKNNSSDFCQDVGKTDDMKSCMFKIRHFLSGYEEATSHVIDCLLSGSLNSSEFGLCLDCLHEGKECLLRSQHIKSLFKILQSQLQIDNPKPEQLLQAKSIKDLLVWLFQKMPLDRKISLLEYFFQVSVDHLDYEDFLLGGKEDTSSVTEVHRQMNIAFNTIVEKLNRDSLISTLCDAAFLSPKLTVEKIVYQAVVNEDLHKTLVEVLVKLDFLTLLTNSNKQNMMLNALCKSLQSDNTDKVIRSTQNFLRLLINQEEKTINDFSLCLLHTILLPSCYSNKTGLPFRVTLSLLNHLYFKNKSIKEIAVVDLVLLSYSLALHLESGTISDEMLSIAKLNLPLIVNLIVEKLNVDTKNYVNVVGWCGNLCKSLNWTTQLYFKPILKRNQDYTVLLPDSLGTVCKFPEELSVTLIDGYGEGTGLTAWFQCIISDPSLIPLSPLELEFASVADQDMFCNGIVVALSQVLPYSIEEDWNSIFEVLISLHQGGHMFVTINQEIFQGHLCPNLEVCSLLLCLVQLVCRVTLIWGSKCCKKWMKRPLWSRVCRCYTATMKELVQRCFPANIVGQTTNLYVLHVMFLATVDFITLLEGLTDLQLSQAVETIYVLAIDFASEFKKLVGNAVKSEDSQSTEKVPLILLRQLDLFLKPMKETTELISDSHKADTLSQMLNKITF